MKLRIENGITLIALIITIIVMLILVGVTVTITLNGGLFDTAKDAAAKYSLAEAQEKMTMEWAMKYARIKAERGILDKEEALEELKTAMDAAMEANGFSEDFYHVTTLESIQICPKNSWSVIETTATAKSVNEEKDEYIEIPKLQVSTDGETMLEIGDFVQYDLSGTTVSNYQGQWRIIGAENGNLLIMSTADIGTTSFSGRQNYVNILNEACAPYGTGDKALKARSVTDADVNKVMKYNPAIHYEDTMSGAIASYGEDVTYYWDGDALPYWEASNGNTGNLNQYDTYNHSTFYYYDKNANTWQSITQPTEGVSETSKQKITTLTYDHYMYVAGEFYENHGLIYPNSKAGRAFFHNDNKYWLASVAVTNKTNYTSFGMRCVRGYQLDDMTLSHSSGKAYDQSANVYGIRAVVYIKPDATLTKVSEATLSEVLPQTAEHKAVQEKTVTWKID